jgi:RNA 2',3'-cyclic 3'-phosphodiesterase
MRLFVAVDLDAAAHAAIVDEQHRLGRSIAGGTKLRWMNPEQMHVTLVFLGEIREAQLDAVMATYAEPASLPRFDMVLGGIGAFPERGSPRALWVGIRQGERELIALQQAMAARARAVGVPLEQRPFTPHVTIGRWKNARPSDRRRVLDEARDDAIARVGVSRATLYESRLGSGGSTYVPQAHVTLTTPR